jgi:hypothetical protein
VLDSAIMFAIKPQIKFIWIAALLLASLACRAATRLIIPDTPTPLPTTTTTATPTLTATSLPTFTPTVIFEASCPSLIEAILNTVTATVHISERPDQMFQEEGAISLVTYDVTNDKISRPRIEIVPDELEDEQDDRVTHEEIWDYFASIVPAEEREFVSEFSIFTDGAGNHLGGVSYTFPDPEQWGLHVDILDAESYHDLTYTLIHEQGHLLTLNAEQVVPSDDLFELPENKTIYRREAAACSQYFTGQGCSEPDSYINQYFTRFWPYLYEEWEEINLEEDEETRSILLEEFYKIYADQFVSEYAATSPAEDIAESWSFFILTPKPELNSIANEKILFFYEYPELVALRTQILTNICAEFPQ